MEKYTIPIVFTLNNNYVLYTYIAIYSLIKNASDDNLYLIYILHTNLSDNNCELLETLGTKNVKIKCMNIEQCIVDIVLEGTDKLPIEVYYRLFISEIFSEYEKVLYLDCDICVLEDVSKLYKTDIKDYTLAATLNNYSKVSDEHYKALNLDVRKTFCTSVLLINTAQFKKQKILERSIELLNEDYLRSKRLYGWTEQDVLNIILYENFYILDRKWSYTPSTNEYGSTPQEVCIRHYAGGKPWENPEILESPAEFFWDFAVETDIFKKILSQIMTKAQMWRYITKYPFPYERVSYKSKVIIYAAGEYGKVLVSFLKASKYAELVLWVDKNWEKMDTELGVKAIDEIANVEFDFLIIAVENEKIVNEIKGNLFAMHIPESKIIWNWRGYW